MTWDKYALKNTLFWITIIVMATLFMLGLAWLLGVCYVNGAGIDQWDRLHSAR